MFRIALTAALVATAAPALANEPGQRAPQVADARNERCAVRHIYAHAGKTVPPAAVMECKQVRSVETAERGTTPRERKQSGVD